MLRISSGSHVCPATRDLSCGVTSAATPGKFTVFAPRQRDVEYSADHLDGRWVIRTNWDAPNFRFTNSEKANQQILSRQYREGFAPPTVA